MKSLSIIRVSLTLSTFFSTNLALAKDPPSAELSFAERAQLAETVAIKNEESNNSEAVALIAQPNSKVCGSPIDPAAFLNSMESSKPELKAKIIEKLSAAKSRHKKSDGSLSGAIAYEGIPISDFFADVETLVGEPVYSRMSDELISNCFEQSEFKGAIAESKLQKVPNVVVSKVKISAGMKNRKLLKLKLAKAYLMQMKMYSAVHKESFKVATENSKKHQ